MKETECIRNEAVVLIMWYARDGIEIMHENLPNLPLNCPDTLDPLGLASVANHFASTVPSF